MVINNSHDSSTNEATSNSNNNNEAPADSITIPHTASANSSGSSSPRHRRSASFSQNSYSTIHLAAAVATCRPPIVKETSLCGWTIQSVRSSISSAAQIEILAHEMGFPLPTMFFGSNRVILRGPGDFELYFDPIEAMRTVSKSADSVPVRIAASHADFWRQKSLSEPVFDYDWTYTPQNYMGKMNGDLVVVDACPDPPVEIDYGRLKRQDPILFFDENILYEDELGDNGISIVLVKIRVMEYGFYVLLKHFLRVDQVSFKAAAVRYFHDFSTNHLVREIRHSEDTFDSIASKLILSGGSFKDTETVLQHLPVTHVHVEKIKIK